MTFTIEFLGDWWLIPAAITIIAFVFAMTKFVETSGNDYGLGGMVNLLFLSMAAVASLLAWLIWAVLT